MPLCPSGREGGGCKPVVFILTLQHHDISYGQRSCIASAIILHLLRYKCLLRKTKQNFCTIQSIAGWCPCNRTSANSLPLKLKSHLNNAFIIKRDYVIQGFVLTCLRSSSIHTLVSHCHQTHSHPQLRTQKQRSNSWREPNTKVLHSKTLKKMTENNTHR